MGGLICSTGVKAMVKCARHTEIPLLAATFCPQNRGEFTRRKELDHIDTKSSLHLYKTFNITGRTQKYLINITIKNHLQYLNTIKQQTQYTHLYPRKILCS
jgi:hypothetical protein